MGDMPSSKAILWWAAMAIIAGGGLVVIDWVQQT